MSPTPTSAIFSNDFKTKPYWWEAYQPKALPEFDLPKNVPVVIIGAGYTGLNAALEMARHGTQSLVLDAAEPGFGGSTRNGGIVSAGVTVGKRMINRALTPAEAKPFLNDASEAFPFVESLIADNGINCGWTKSGYFLGAWCASHFAAMEKKSALLNEEAQSDAHLVPKSEQHSEIGTDYYHGGMVVERAAHLHPALYFKGLLQLASAAGVEIASRTPVTKVTQVSQGQWQVSTPRGVVRAGKVIVASNGYTGDATPQFKRRLVPVGSYIIATEELPDDLVHSISPRNRSFADTRRVLTYYRLSPDRKRLIFGGRAKFGFTDPLETAPLLYRFMLERFPQMRGVKITHSWTGNVAFTLDELPHLGVLDGLYYALGCNGSGIAMMSFLGREIARKAIGQANRQIAFEQPQFRSSLFYNGNPWFLPLAGAWMRSADWVDRRFR